MKKAYSVKTVSTVFITLFFLLFGAAIIFLANAYMKKQALIEAESKALIIADLSLSIHTYFSHDLKPAVFKISDEIYPESYFEPVWMSSTYAVRGIKKYFAGLNDMGYYYKECAVNARSPENEADDYEREFIRQINTGDINSRTSIREIDGRRYLDILRKGETMEKGCLRCHSDPINAPRELTEYYGAERSFFRNEGEVISAISIRIPLEEAYSSANRLSVILSGILLVILGGYTAGYLSFINRFIFSPLLRLHGKAVRIARDRKALGTTIETGGSSEIRELAEAFNEMSIQLASSVNGLENRLQERTAEISRTNEELKRSLDEKNLLFRELHHRIKNNMSMVAGLLMLQADSVENTPAEASLKEAHGRLINMMRLYDRLYVKADYGRIMTGEYLPGLIDEIRDTFGDKDKITLNRYVENFETDSRALFPLSIIIYELVTNSFKYGFPENREGTINVRISKISEKTAEILVEDDGAGLPDELNISELKSFGLYLVKSLAEQGGGTLELRRKKGAGFSVTLLI